MPFCSNCGSSCNNTEKYCHNCGSPLSVTRQKGTLIISRRKGAKYSDKIIDIYIDGSKFGEIREKGSITIYLPFGSHRVEFFLNEIQIGFTQVSFTDKIRLITYSCIVSKSGQCVPYQSKSSGVITGAILAVLIVLVILSKAFPSNPKPYDIQNDTHMQSTLWIQAQEAVKSDLKSPSSAHFPSLILDRGGAITFGNKTDNQFYVSSYVDAENGFGATIRTYFRVYAIYDGDQFDLLNIEYY